jgi:threonine dehydrogenase-like Zn-dependent dehydrogenase
MGLFFLQLVRQQSSGPITVVDLQPRRLEVARELGADQVIEADGARGETSWQQAHSFDCVVDATGAPTVIEAAFSYLVPGGKLLLLGSPPTAALVTVSPRLIQRQDATVVGTYGYGHEFAAALELLQAGRIQTSSIVTHQFPLEDFPEAWEWASMGRDCIKVQIVP